MKHCDICRVAYPDSYNFCPDHGSRLASHASDSVRQCSSCGGALEAPDGLCSGCSADLGDPPSTTFPANGGAAVNRATLSNAEAEAAAPVDAEPAKPANSSDFERKLNDDLSAAFSFLEPSETPWFGMDRDSALLAIAPHGITVAEIVAPPGIESASIHKSLFAQGPWLLTKTDGTDLPIDNPVTKTNRTMRSIEERLKTFLTSQGKSPRVAVRGVAVFPDGYDLAAANEAATSAEAGHAVRVINASELPKELLRPLHNHRLSSGLYRTWLHASVLRDPDDDSIALTWLDPDGDTISKRVGALGARKPTQDRPNLPPTTSEIFAEPPRRPAGRKAGSTITAGLSLLLGLGAYLLWEIYPPPEPAAEGRRVSEESKPQPTLPQSEEPAPAQPPERKEMPGRKDSSPLKNLVVPENPTDRRENTVSDGDPPNTIAPTEKSIELGAPSEPTASWRKTVEHQIDKAIQMRAVDGVVVIFVNDTAYLTGAVLSEAQKTAAEEAARNVSGVKRVQSSISVKWDRMTDG